MRQDKNIRLRRSKERRYEDFDESDNWLTFSFANYHDPEWMRFASLRAITENNIQPHQGFSSHPHKNMEIVTYVSGGVLTHADNTGNTEAIGAGEMQRMTAGSGIVHSEKNEHDEIEHNIQVWILPNKAGLEPGYQMKRLSQDESVAPVEHNYRNQATLEHLGQGYHTKGEQPGLSCFLQDGDDIYHTYSTFGRGMEAVGGANYFLDLTALG